MRLSRFSYYASYPGSKSYKYKPQLYFPYSYNKKVLKEIFADYIISLVDGLLKERHKLF